MYNIFTCQDGIANNGAVVETYKLIGAGISVPAILIGECGRGRELGILPVQLPDSLYAEWQEKGQTKILAAEISQTKAGKPKLLASAEPVDKAEHAICVLRTPIGYRGSNSHTGDLIGWSCRMCNTEGDDLDTPRQCPKCGASGYWDSPDPKYASFPGEILIRGIIAQGAAGRMGEGEQLVAILPKNIIWRTGYFGRRYGNPAAHYWVFNGSRILVATWEEREISDIF